MKHSKHGMHPITRAELFQAQLALVAAVLLQIASRRIGSDYLPGSQYLIIVAEIALIVVLSFTTTRRELHGRALHRGLAVILLALLSFANVSSLVFVLTSLITTHSDVNGPELLSTAIAIFITNIIVYALWYWEIDSPGLTRQRWSKHDKDFQFTHQDLHHDFPGWQPQFADYLYHSVTNAVNFAPADTRPLTLQAKALMASQSLISVFTLALLVARSVSILGA